MSVECVNLCKSYHRRTVLRNLGFSMREPGVLAVLGPNGSGKTTLLRLLAGLETPDSGRIEVFGKPFTRKDIRAAGVCYAGLVPVMLNRSVRENLAYPLQLRKWAEPALCRQVDRHLECLGLAALSDQSAIRLSSGEKQKLALGRALIGTPRVLLLDEPTASIDADTQGDIEALLTQAVAEQGCHIILATHQAGQADRLGAAVLQLWREEPE